MRPGWPAMVVSGVGALWAAAMVQVGFSACFGGMSALPVSTGILRLLGIAGVAGGLFVFMVLVADRWFHHALRPMVVVSEIVMLVVFWLAAVWIVILLSQGAAT